MIKKKMMLSAALAASMAMSMFSMTALAEGDGTITINAAENADFTADTAFAAYRLLDAKYVSGTGENAQYVYTINTAFSGFFTSVGCSTDDEAYDYVKSNAKGTLASAVKAWLENNQVASVGTGSVDAVNDTYTISGLEGGYYLVVQTDEVTGDILDTVALELTEQKNITVTQKANYPTINKQIKHNETGVWGEVGDNQISDEVEYRIEMTLPNVADYSSYTYLVHDYMDSTLSFNSQSVKGYKDADLTQELEDTYTYALDTGESIQETDNCTACDFHFSLDRDTLADLNAAGIDTLYLYYTCTLTADAKIASEHNDNTAYLEYTKSISNGTENNDTTEEDTVYDYTFVFSGIKQNANSEALAGAEFELKDVNGNKLYFTKDANGDYVVSKSTDAGASATIVTADTTGALKIKGLDDAVAYTLTETKAPNGYVAADPITFTINASYDTSNELSNLSVTNADSNKTTVAVDSNTNNITATIIDVAKSILPSTGGIGTTVFYVVGIVLMAGAAVLLVAKKKSSVEE